MKFREWLTLFIKAIVEALTKPKPPQPPEPQVYTVTRGQRVDTPLKVPCKLEFDIMGLKPTSPDIEAHLAWAVEEGKDWQGGNPQPTTIYSASAKDYKLKCGAFGERGFYGPAANWKPELTYHFALEIGGSMTTETISHKGAILAQVSVSASAPERVVVSYGWPPTKRNGAEGAKLTNIVWKTQ